MIGTLGERLHPAVEGHIASQMRVAFLSVGRVTLHLAVLEGHRRQSATLRCIRQLAVLLARRFSGVFGASTAPLHLHAGEQRAMKVCAVGQMIAAQLTALCAWPLKEGLDRYIHP